MQPALPGTSLDSDEILTVMDIEQERLAKNFGEGHRLLRGVAGSGKTLTLVCRARESVPLPDDVPWPLARPGAATSRNAMSGRRMVRNP